MEKLHPSDRWKEARDLLEDVLARVLGCALEEDEHLIQSFILPPGCVYLREDGSPESGGMASEKTPSTPPAGLDRIMPA